MANRNFPVNKLFQPQLYPVLLNAKITIGASGAVSSSVAPYIKSITKLSAAGTYEIRLQDNYNSLLNVMSSVVSPLTGSPVTAGSFSAGTAYRITTVGTTNYNLIGLPAGVTAAVGMAFVATGVGAGTGTATAIGNSGLTKIEVLDNGAELAPAPSSNGGGVIVIQCLGPTDATHPALIPTNPVSGSVLMVSIYLSNSSVSIA